MDTQTTCIRILLVDDHAAIRRGLRHLLAACRDMDVAGEAAGLLPAVVLLDVRLPGLDGVQLAPRLRRAVPSVRIILLASLSLDEQKAAAPGSCIDGWLWKREADERLAETIRAVVRGEHPLGEYLPKIPAQQHLA
jgi:DNA-binding NarL/FixJ family response regulator